MKDIRIELRWAILFSFVLMIWMLIEHSLGWHQAPKIAHQLGYHFIAQLVLYAAVYYVAIKQKRDKDYEGKITWKRALLSGAFISVIVALLSPLTQYFIYHYISPEYFSNMIAYQVNKAEFPMTEKAAQDFFSMKSFIIQGVFTSLSTGLIASALIGLAVRTKSAKKS